MNMKKKKPLLVIAEDIQKKVSEITSYDRDSRLKIREVELSLLALCEHLGLELYVFDVDEKYNPYRVRELGKNNDS